MAQYDIPILQEDASGKFVRTLLAPGSTAGHLGTTESTRVPSVVPVAVGGLQVEDNVTATSIAGSATWTKFVSFGSVSAQLGVTASMVSNDITIAQTGTYLVQYSVSFTGGATDIIEWEVQKTTGTRLPATNAGMKLASADLTHLSGVGIVSLTAGDVVALYVNNLTDADDVTAKDVSLTVLRVA